MSTILPLVFRMVRLGRVPVNSQVICSWIAASSTAFQKAVEPIQLVCRLCSRQRIPMLTADLFWNSQPTGRRPDLMHLLVELSQLMPLPIGGFLKRRHRPHIQAPDLPQRRLKLALPLPLVNTLRRRRTCKHHRPLDMAPKLRVWGRVAMAAVQAKMPARRLPGSLTCTNDRSMDSKVVKAAIMLAEAHIHHKAMPINKIFMMALTRQQNRIF
jgi:hypothetical protein